MKRRQLHALLGAAAAAAITTGLVACDQVYADPISIPAPSFGGTTLDAGPLVTPRPAPYACRDERLLENGPCLVEGAKCETGKSSDPLCNATFVCVLDRYGRYWTEGRQSECEGQCPTTPIVDGAPCNVGTGAGTTPTEAELQCVSNDRLCGCTTGRDGAHAHERRWVCTTAGEGCPSGRPLIGSTCLGDRVCDYGGCTLKRGTGMICEQGVWQVEATKCRD